MRSVVLVGLLASALIGCRATQRADDSDYQTVGKDVRRDTERASAENARAIGLIREGKVLEAEKTLRSALTADVMYGPAHNNLGKIYYERGQYYLAAWEFQYASKLMPNQPEPRNNLGLVYEAVGKLDQAVESYEQARTLEPDNPQLIGNLARSRLRRGERSPQVRQLLEELVVRETRPQWASWARERLALMPPGTPATSAPVPATSEDLPTE